MSGWGCPHELTGLCQRLKGRTCQPGQPGCILYGNYRFFVDEPAAEGTDGPSDTDRTKPPAD